jgi:hypothetical protein
MKITKGEWVTTSAFTVETPGPKGIRLATICTSGRPSGIPAKSAEFLEEAKANMLAIATVPELLELAEYVASRKAFESGGRGVAVAKAEKALKKAGILS